MSQSVSVANMLQNQTDLQGRITRAFENLKKLGVANYSVGVVEARLHALEQNWKKFEAQHEQMQLHFRDTLASSVYVTEDAFGSTEEAYLQNKGHFLDILSQIKPTTPPETSVAPSHEGRTSSSLPRIQLPQFSGKYSDWISFRDLFTSLIRKESSLTNVEKLHYLKSCVKGEADELLKNINISSENFTLAWQTLSNRYENKRLIVRNHLQTLTSLLVMPKESSDDLKRVLQVLYSAVGGLESIGRPVNATTDLLVHLIVDRLDSKTKRGWEDSISGSAEPPSYDDLKSFLENRLRTLEALNPSESKVPTSSSSRRVTQNAKTHLVEQQKSAKSRCSLCSRNHFILFCDEFKRMQPSARNELVSRCNLCSNCLGKHPLTECRSTRTCSKCSQKHHTSIHDAIVPQGSESQGKSILTSYRCNKSCILLATAMVTALDRAGGPHTVRALIDPGSEVSLVTEGLVRRLRLPRSAATVPILGIGASSSGVARGRATLDIRSRVNSTQFQINALILPRLTAYEVSCSKDIAAWPHLKGLELADPQFNRKAPIELLLGADIYTIILEDGIRKGNPQTPMAQKTALGWILSGVISSSGSTTPATSLQCSVDNQLHDLVQRFWTQEEVPRSSSQWTEDEQRCEDHFARTHFRLQDGRYVVRLPLKADLPSLVGTRNSACRLLAAMENRFSKDDSFASLYRIFMNEYKQLDHMDIAPGDHTSRLCYLPHHGVLRQQSQTTKLRVVFNGSQRLNSGESLNDFLLTGPKLLPDLSDVVLRCRRHKYVFAADIEKMYRQVRVHTADRDLQRIVWRNSPNEPIQDFQLKTVTYGLACAPFLAIRTLHQLATDEAHRFPLAAAAIRQDVYVDDVLSGASTIEDALELQHQLSKLCMAGGFPLRKWVANDKRLRAHLFDESTAADLHMTRDENLIHSTLGLRWHPRDDCFSFSCESKPLPMHLTKRSVLSNLAQLFDPLGWLAPTICYAKIFFQSLWLQRLDWDTPLHPRDELLWRNYTEELPHLGHIRIPRFFGNPDESTELHGFADASERAYAAVLYLRCTSGNSNATSTLLMAKTRVAPLKQISLPRLELSAAVLLTRLASHVTSTLLTPDVPVHLWTDSMVTLGWIQAHPSKWKTFVANRVSEIQQLIPAACWHHVSSSDNPADCASRGLRPRELGPHSLWWHGPSWLTLLSSTWSTADTVRHPDCLPEQRRAVHAAQLKMDTTWDLEQRFSSFDVLLRVTAWCKRWLRVTRQRTASATTPTLPSYLTTEEIQEARLFWLKHVQRTHYQKEIDSLMQNRTIPSRSPLRKLNPILDSQGLLRVGGRLKHALLSHDEKHPVILPSRAALTHLIITRCHHRTLHGGVQQTLGLLRRQYWILQGRQAVKSCIYRCISCVRWRAATPQPQMGDLPQDRVSPTKPFAVSGLDYAGPVLLRASKGRGHRTYKGYIALFVCFSTRAVHLELVSDYSTETFLAAFRRFTSRRGLCRTLCSDCGTNFIGADAQLRKLFTAATQEFKSLRHQLQKDGLEWRFNPPAAPHFGGLWEAAVKSVKFHLRRVIGDATLTFEEMYTLLTQIEACLNSRPLQAITDDPDDASPLTPAHFLGGSDLLTMPEPSLDDVSANRLSRWQLIQQMRDHFWRRWSDEYLHTLQTRVKWWRTGPTLRVGDLCLIKNELYPPSRWPLARITKTHPGLDGQIRVVTVRVRNTELKRPATKIVVLPGTSDHCENL